MAQDPRTGKILQGRYKIAAPLAEGGMGIVYKGERVGIGRPVVVKFLHTVLSEQPGIVDRFEREARATARLNHPNCVALVDYGIEEGSPYLVMEYAEGKTLADLLDFGALSPRRAVHIAKQVLAGLSHAHDRGILHRDLKPANIMVVDAVGHKDFVKILDFGLAKLLGQVDGKRDVTVQGIAIGTPGYMSPEQAAGVPSDRRADIYCTGALLYHLVTGTKAFEGDDIHSVLRRHREETPQSPRAIKGAAPISNDLERVIERSMEREPAKRYQNAEEMIAALDKTPEAKLPLEEGARGDKRASSSTDGPPTRAEPKGRRGMRKARGVGLVLGAGVVLGAAASFALAVYTPLLRTLTPPPAPAPVVARTGESPRLSRAELRKRLEAKLESPRPESPKAEPRPEPPKPELLAAAPPTPATPTTSGDDEPVPGEPKPEAQKPEAQKPEAQKAEAQKAEAQKPEAQKPEAQKPEPARPTLSPDDDVVDPALVRAEDGSNEDDRAPPAAPPGAPRRDVPQVRTLADVKTLLRKGDADSALAGLYRLRRLRPPPSPRLGAEIATLIGHIYFDRKWWTEALREYRFACRLDALKKRDETLLNNTVRTLGDRGTYWRARRLLQSYIGRPAIPALRSAARSGSGDVKRRAAKLLEQFDGKTARHAKR